MSSQHDSCGSEGPRDTGPFVDPEFGTRTYTKIPNQLPKEPAEAFAAFCEYIACGSLDAVRGTLGGDRGRRQVQRWSRLWHWDDRAWALRLNPLLQAAQADLDGHIRDTGPLGDSEFGTRTYTKIPNQLPKEPAEAFAAFCEYIACGSLDAVRGTLGGDHGRRQVQRWSRLWHWDDRAWALRLNPLLQAAQADLDGHIRDTGPLGDSEFGTRTYTKIPNQLPKEPAEAFAAFCEYIACGSLDAVRGTLGGDHGRWQVQRWSRLWHWDHRAWVARFEPFFEGLQATMESRIQQAMATGQHALKPQIEAAFGLHRRGIKRVTQIPPEELTPRDVLNLLVKGAELERAARGSPCPDAHRDAADEAHAAQQVTLFWLKNRAIIRLLTVPDETWSASDAVLVWVEGCRLERLIANCLVSARPHGAADDSSAGRCPSTITRIQMDVNDVLKKRWQPFPFFATANGD